MASLETKTGRKSAGPISTNLSIFLPRARTHAHTHTHTHTHALTLALTGEDQTRTAARGLFSQASSPITTLLEGQWAPVSVLLAPVLYDAGNSISSRRWKINLDRAFPFLLRIRTHPGKPELPERGRSGRNRHPTLPPGPSPSRSAPGSAPGRCPRRKLWRGTMRWGWMSQQ